MNNSRAEIMASLQKASSLAEQIALVSELEALDARQASNIAEDRSLDFTSAIVEQTLSPVRVHEFHTASTDWLSMDDDTQDNNYHQAVMAEASLWFNRISDEVKNDVPEFVEQARGIARRTASTYGVYAPDAEQSFLQYVAFLNREAASGLDQVDQLIDPNNMPKATEYPAATFPTFEDPVHPINDQAVAQEGTYNNPLLAEIEQLGGGQGQGEWPPVPGGGTANFANVTSVAISHSYNLDEFRQREAASTLDQINQTTAPDGVTYKPTPLPGEVAYPWMLGGPVVDPEADDQDFTQAAPAAIDKAVAARRTAAPADSSCRSCDATGKTKDGKNSCGNCGGMGMVPAEVNAPKNASRRTAENENRWRAKLPTWTQIHGLQHGESMQFIGADGVEHNISYHEHVPDNDFGNKAYGYKAGVFTVEGPKGTQYHRVSPFQEHETSQKRYAADDVYHTMMRNLRGPQIEASRRTAGSAEWDGKYADKSRCGHTEAEQDFVESGHPTPKCDSCGKNAGACCGVPTDSGLVFCGPCHDSGDYMRGFTSSRKTAFEKLVECPDCSYKGRYEEFDNGWNDVCPKCGELFTVTASSRAQPTNRKTAGGDCTRCMGGGHDSCTACKGTGLGEESDETCYKCGGQGEIPCWHCEGSGSEPSAEYAQKKQDFMKGMWGLGSRKTASRKTADMYGNSDMPHAVPQPNVANSPATTPQPQQGGSYTAGFAAGMADGANGDAPTYSDASSGLAFSSGYVAGYQKGIGEARDERNPKDMPYSAGGDNGQAFLSGTAGRNPFRRKGPAADLPTDVSKLHLERPGKYIDDETLPYSQRYESDQIWRGNSPSPKHAPENNKDLEKQLDDAQAQRTSSLFTPEDANQDPEFRKAYKFASKWDASKPLVRTGSAEFEAGLYAGISDNIGSQEAWVAKHRKQANKYPEFSQRIALHKDFSLKVISDQGGIMKGAYLRVESATSTDLDTMAPDATPSPVGETPINGSGRPGPNAGGTDPARPGGPAPYNGVEPFGQSVINAEINVSMPATKQLTSARRLANFRQAIEDNISLVTEEN